jgi:predicted acylesterase/phospholipase RssA
MHRGFILSLVLAATAGLALLGCRHAAKRECVPAELSTSPLREAEGECTFPMTDPDLYGTLQKVIERDQSRRVAPDHRPQNYLVLSGGGVLGAFTVGVLNGWSDSGKRPQFDVVTGISTGALIATHAFLGSKYDYVLRDYYSNYGADEVYRERKYLSLLWADSAVSVEPLKQKIDAALTDEVFAEIAAAHQSGRRLYVGTTNLDTGKLVIWDMGAIAASGRPDARKLYRDVILASASIPGFFPPVKIDVEINGQRYEEMHVDGGTTAAVFFQPFMLNLDKNDLRSRAGSNLYVVVAGKLFANARCVEPRILPIASTAIRSTLYSSSRNDLARLYTLALITGVKYNLAAVPQDFTLNLDIRHFDQNEMRRLYEEGYRQGKSGTDWHTRLDNTGLGEEIAPRCGTRFVTVP